MSSESYMDNDIIIWHLGIVLRHSIFIFHTREFKTTQRYNELELYLLVEVDIRYPDIVVRKIDPLSYHYPIPKVCQIDYDREDIFLNVPPFSSIDSRKLIHPLLGELRVSPDVNITNHFNVPRSKMLINFDQKNVIPEIISLEEASPSSKLKNSWDFYSNNGCKKKLCHRDLACYLLDDREIRASIEENMYDVYVVLCDKIFSGETT